MAIGKLIHYTPGKEIKPITLGPFRDESHSPDKALCPTTLNPDCHTPQDNSHLLQRIEVITFNFKLPN